MEYLNEEPEMLKLLKGLVCLINRTLLNSDNNFQNPGLK